MSSYIIYYPMYFRYCCTLSCACEIFASWKNVHWYQIYTELRNGLDKYRIDTFPNKSVFRLAFLRLLWHIDFFLNSISETIYSWSSGVNNTSFRCFFAMYFRWRFDFSTLDLRSLVLLHQCYTLQMWYVIKNI